jgi:hypothetical protein
LFSPAKELKTEVPITVKNDMWAEPSNAAHDTREAAQLLDKVAIPPDGAAQPLSWFSGTRQARNRDFIFRPLSASLHKQSRQPRCSSEPVEDLAKERLDSSVVNSHTRAAKENALASAHD